MLGTVVKWAVLFTALIGIQKYLNYILDSTMMDSFRDFISYIWILDGFIPVDTIFICLLLIIGLHITKIIFNIIFGFIGLFNNSGKPEV